MQSSKNPYRRIVYPIDPAIMDAVGAQPIPNPHAPDEKFRELVDELPADLREVVELIVWGQMSTRDIGRQLGCDHTTVSKRYARALGVLRAGLQSPN
jgi:DNA-directed RNA polymerase specialized sigma24 family protein